MRGKIAVITGGSSGIGEAIAYRFAAEGAKVVVASRNIESCEAVADKIRKNGGEALALQCDVNEEAQVVELFRKVTEELGTPDILIASAGISGGSQPVADYSLEHWNKVIQTNLTGVFLTTREAFRHMKAKGGHIVVISSRAGVDGYASKGVYSATKFGVRGLAQALADEGREYGISVSALCPSTVQTPILAATNTVVEHPLSLDALADAAVYLATLRGNAYVRDIILERMNRD